MIAGLQDAVHRVEESADEAAVTLLCWNCSAPLVELTPETRTGSDIRTCWHCATPTQCREGVWHALSPERIQYFDRFMHDYESIRNAEGRGSTNSEHYLALPFEDTSGLNSEQWAIRARSFLAIEREIVSPLARSHGRPLRILDLGAGNCWMSFRLALQGHLPVAVDLQINDQDGLGAAVHYSSRIQPLFPRIRSEVDRLSFSSFSFDLVIFNASFHYSEDYEHTFAEALRCIKPGGSIVIADTPWYAEEESGKRMVKEKHQRFKAVYGFPSDSIPSLEFLTPDRIHRLQEKFHLKWRTIKPFYGIQWHLRPLRAMLKGRRPPSQFRIYVAEVRP